MSYSKQEHIDTLISEAIGEAIAEGFSQEQIKERLQLTIEDLPQYFDEDKVERINNNVGDICVEENDVCPSCGAKEIICTPAMLTKLGLSGEHWYCEQCEIVWKKWVINRH